MAPGHGEPAQARPGRKSSCKSANLHGTPLSDCHSYQRLCAGLIVSIHSSRTVNDAPAAVLAYVARLDVN